MINIKNLINKFFRTIFFFLVGLGECLIIALNIKFLQKEYLTLSFITGFITVIIWCYIVKFISSLKNSTVYIIFYAVGFGLGNILALKLLYILENLLIK